jgi:hypothetical protein
MSSLLTQVMDAHGGIEHWKKFSAVSASITTGGGFWALKGLVQDSAPRQMTVSLHEQLASVTPFGQADWRSSFRPGRIAVETTDGTLVRERGNPRESFAGHVVNTPWDPLHRAYFNGYALWTYLTAPFFMAMPGFEVSEIEPWVEQGEAWRGLRVRFPDSVDSHSKVQDFYFGSDFLLRRHEYEVDVAGSLPAVQYVHDAVEVQGIRMPTRRRVYVRGPNREAVRDLLLVSIDFRDIAFVR